MNIKTYKLVPVSFFDKVGKDGEFVDDNVKQKNMVTDEEERSVRDIVEANLQNTNFEPSKHYIADFKLGKPSLDGGGVGRLAKPSESVLSSDRDVLSEKSHGVKLRSIDQDLNELLDNDKIPDGLKIKLYTILQRRYEQLKNNTDRGKTGDNNDILDEDNPRHILNDFISDLPKNKIGDGRVLGEILMNEFKHVRWDSEGGIIFPKMRHLGIFDLGYLIRTILYSTSSEKHTMLAAKIIRPFYHKLVKKMVVGNHKLTEFIEREKPISMMSKYVAW